MTVFKEYVLKKKHRILWYVTVKTSARYDKISIYLYIEYNFKNKVTSQYYFLFKVGMTSIGIKSWFI